MKLSSFLQRFYLRFKQNKLSQAAGALTYSTMLAIVPLIMVVFSIFSAFPVFNEVTDALKEFIFANFAPSAGDVVGRYIDEFVNNSKKMSAVGIVSLIAVAFYRSYAQWHLARHRQPPDFYLIRHLLADFNPWPFAYRCQHCDERVCEGDAYKRRTFILRPEVARFGTVFVYLVYFHRDLYGGAE